MPRFNHLKYCIFMFEVDQPQTLFFAQHHRIQATSINSLSHGLPHSPPASADVILVVSHLAQLVDDNGGKVVEPLADRVEHDEAERDADGGVGHGEELSKVRLGRRVAVT